MTTPLTVESHFEGKDPQLKAAYDRMIVWLRQFGSVTESPRQTSIHLEKNSGFAGVRTRKNSFNIEFRIAARIDHPRIKRIQEISVRRYEHTVKIEREEDIDSQLMSWLRSAYELSK